MVPIAVALTAGRQASFHVQTEYCTPLPPRSSRRAIDVLVPGETYGYTYFDWPVHAVLYSYADKTLAAGRSVLAISRLGTGLSGYPHSTQLTAHVSAFVLHQVIAWARHRGYRQVDVVGHSLGSMIAALDAGTWPRDPTRLVLTGALHATAVRVAAGSAVRYLFPARQDWLFAGSGLDTGYLTTLPGRRQIAFYHDANPAVVAYDEAHKDVVSWTEFRTAAEGFLAPAARSNPTDHITAPVLLIVGQDDPMFCGHAGGLDCANPVAVRRHEAPYYRAAASLTYLSVPGTGHDLALSQTATRSFQLINQWLTAHGAP
jgi:pimeloyl-ACP methyl ester carboxylesterase